MMDQRLTINTIALGLCLLCTASLSMNHNIPIEHVLYETLFHDYNKMVRPMSADAGPTVIDVSMEFRYLVNMDERHQIFSGVSWIQQGWYDPRLAWHPRSFNNTTQIMSKLDQIWWPHLIVNNEASNSFSVISNFDTSYMDVLIKHDGYVLTSFPLLHSTFCNMDITKFPFDTQTCLIRLASPGTPASMLSIRTSLNDGLTLAVVSRHGQWNIVSVRTFNDTNSYKSRFWSTIGSAVSSILIEIEICRRPDYYILTIALPATIIMLLALFVFFIPVESGEKLSYIISLVLGITIFQLFVEGVLPPVSQRPLLGMYVTIIFLNLVLWVLISVITVSMIYKSNNNTSPPSWIRTLAMVSKQYICWCGKCSTRSERGDDVDKSGERANQNQNQLDAAISYPRDDRPTVTSTENSCHLTDSDAWRVVARLLDIVVFIVTIIIFLVQIAFIIINGLLEKCVDYRDL